MHALHPLYLSLDALAPDMPERLAARVADARAALDQPAVDYEGTMAAKLGIARALFDCRGAGELEVRWLLKRATLGEAALRAGQRCARPASGACSKI